VIPMGPPPWWLCWKKHASGSLVLSWGYSNEQTKLLCHLKQVDWFSKAQKHLISLPKLSQNSTKHSCLPKNKPKSIRVGQVIFF
jgi:hypothetical protein